MRVAMISQAENEVMIFETRFKNPEEVRKFLRDLTKMAEVVWPEEFTDGQLSRPVDPDTPA